MDFDPREFLDPDEEYEAMYAEEEEMMRELEQKQKNEECPSRKSLNFDNVPNFLHHIETVHTYNCTEDQFSSRELTSRPNDLTGNETFSTKNWAHINNENINTCIPNGNSSERAKSKDSSPLLFANFSDSLGNCNINMRLPISQTNNFNSNKRSIQSLFGDIDDINDIDFGHDVLNDLSSSLNKPTKLTDNYEEQQVDKDLLTINRILRKRARIQCEIKDNANYVESSKLIPPPLLLTRRVPKYAFITLRNGNNEKFYAKLISNDNFNDKVVLVSEQCKNCRLLATSFEIVMQNANTILEKKFVANEQTVVSNATRADFKKLIETELWVEKYKPNCYWDLLSDEGTNRILLQWLKLWDKVVFGRETRVIKDSVKSVKFNKMQLEDNLDENSCPKHKIALLCGAPGLGKTTLAHVVAKHAGYNVVEMNASDDRSLEIFMQQLVAATQMKAVLGISPKPNCLIIDEIDGAPTASIECLIKLAKDELKSRGKKKKFTSLKRPIICICNDVYVPALRLLRQIAFVVHFPPASQQRLAQRLVDVAATENIKTDLGAMLALCEKTNNDIRSCIATIHCLKHEHIKRTTIQNANVGSKDMQKGLFAVWLEIFQINAKTIEYNVADIVRQLGYKNRSEGDMFRMKRMISVLRTVQSHGDYDRLVQGVYENFLNMPINDRTMRNVSIGLEWFCHTDWLKNLITHTQTYTLMAYIPYSFVAWNFLFANYQKPRITYPNLTYELTIKQAKNHQIVQEVLKGMEVKIRAYSHHEQLLLDTLPLITYVLNPNFRQVTIQLFSKTEKEALRRLISTMIDYNLNFIQGRKPDGSYEFELDPNINRVVDFFGTMKQKHLTYSLKLMIAQEIEQEKIRRFEKILLKTNPHQNSSNLLVKITENVVLNEDVILESSTQVTENTLRTQNHLQKLTPKIIKKSPTNFAIKDFFGRIINKSTLKNPRDIKLDEIVKSDIWFHFKEGFSNAVRRTVYMKDLL